MPVLDLPSRHGVEMVNGDLCYVLGVMCCPDSPEKALELCHGSALDDLIRRLKAASQAGMQVEVDGEVALDLVGHISPRKKLWAELAADHLAFVSSAYILRWIVSRSMSDSTRAEASVGRAASAVCQWLKSHKRFRGASRDTVKRYWRDYRSVSHLWAAWQIIGEGGIDHATPDGFRYFLNTAQWLLHQGSLIVPNRARQGEPVLSRDAAWQMPADFPPGPFAWFDDLDAHDIRKAAAPATGSATGAKQRP